MANKFSVNLDPKSVGSSNNTVKFNFKSLQLNYKLNLFFNIKATLHKELTAEINNIIGYRLIPRDHLYEEAHRKSHHYFNVVPSLCIVIYLDLCTNLKY